MAAGAVIGALRVVIGADSAALDKGLKQSQSALQNFGTQVASIAAGIGLERIIEKATSALVGGVKHALTLADDLGKAAQKVGLPVEELSKLKFAADLADVSFESLSKGIVKFDKGLAVAAAGGVNDVSKALAAMGISITDSNGKVKDQTQLLGEVADKFKTYEDGAEKTTLALALFSRGGADLIPLLNQGKKGLEEAGAAAAKTGNIISSETAAASERFNDSMKILTANSQGFANAIAKGAVPALNQLATVLNDNSGGADKFANVTKITEVVMRGLSAAVILAADGLTRFANIWVALAQAVGAAAGGDFTRAKDILVELGTTIKTGLVQSVTNAASVISGQLAPATITLDQVFTAVYGTTEKLKASIGDLATVSKNALQSFLDSTAKSTAVREAEIATIGLSAGARERARVTTEAETIAKQNNIPITAALNAEIAKTAAAAGAATTGVAGATTAFENTDPLVRYQTELANVTNSMLKVGATADQIARAQSKIADQFGVSWSAIGTNIAGTAGALSRLTATVGKENKSMLALSKALGIGEAIINTQIAVTKAFASLPPPASYAAAALAVATGAAAIATITAQGFAQGGSFQIGGGTSLSDNQMVPLSLAAGERVDVTPAGSGSGGAPTTINIDMRDRDPYYSRGNIERLLDALHTVTEDGHQVRLVVLK